MLLIKPIQSHPRAARIRPPIRQRVEKAERWNPSLEPKDLSGTGVPGGVRKTLTNRFMRKKDFFPPSSLIIHRAVGVSDGRSGIRGNLLFTKFQGKRMEHPI
jgi:hypothetical protein